MEIKTPKWIYEGFTAVQAIENVPHGLRLGLCTEETARLVREQRDPKMAEVLGDQGINFVILDGVRGLGPEIDMAEVRANVEISRALKEKGIRRVLYTQTIGQVISESFFQEIPEATNWMQRGPDGQVPTFGPKWWQYIPCLNNPDFMQYVKQMVRSVMKILDLDGIFTDLFGYFSYTCVCDHCRNRFRNYVDRKYLNPEARRARFGSLAVFDPPPFRTLGYTDYRTGIPDPYTILDPVSQEWIQFRCHRLGEVTRELNETIKTCNPEGILYVNYLFGGVPGLNNAAFHGAWPEFILPECDLFSAEVAGKPELLTNGIVKSRIVQMKVGKSFGIPVTPAVTRTDLADFKRLYLAEGMAFNTSPFDWVGQIKRDDPPSWMAKYLEFSRDNRNLLSNAETIADCTVLHSFESLSYTCEYPHQSAVLCEQSLMQENFTFNIIFDRDLNYLGKYRCLFLPNVVSMSEARAKTIAEYVKRGGCLVATEDTGVLNEFLQPWKGERYRREKSHILGELLGFEWPEEGTKFLEVDDGRVAIVGRVDRPDKAGGSISSDVQLSHSYGPEMPLYSFARELAVNHEEIVSALDYALGGERTLRIDAEGPVVGEITRNANGTFVHLLNWDEEGPIENIKVMVRMGGGERTETVELISPDLESRNGTLAIDAKEGFWEFEVPQLCCYSIVMVRTQGS